MDNNFCHTVSVGIPTYNRPEGLRRTLECITRQTYTNLEIIVSDNCTQGVNRDKVDSVIRDFLQRDDRIRFCRQEQNILAENFEFVLKEASSEFFMWASDDDYWEPDFIFLCMQCLLSNNKYTGAFSYFKNIDLLGHQVRLFEPKITGTKSFASIFKLCFEHEFMGKANFIHSVFRKKELLKALEVNRFSPWENFADTNLVIAMYMMGGIGIVPTCLFYKTQPILFPYSDKIDEKEACRARVITRRENFMYIKRLCITSFSNDCFLPTFLALGTRVFYEFFNSFLRFFKRLLL